MLHKFSVWKKSAWVANEVTMISVNGSYSDCIFRIKYDHLILSFILNEVARDVIPI